MEETSERKKVSRSSVGEPLFLDDPCNYFQQLIWGVLKCLGFESGPQNSSSNVDDNKGGDETGYNQGSSSSVEQPADPPASSAADPPADPPAMMATVRRRPRNPTISGGRGPQTNTADPS
ncbi:hypothetical protein Salat_1142500 [Sesamum alatum]|uniref:Uncharacterized protein n=1 Tax=Sesamum alatum TaxID=300844 RepID=A0AAE1YE68_9LAMI|nr:hypothetical protein Salat_1142500 [Sesamum alatum]